MATTDRQTMWTAPASPRASAPAVSIPAVCWSGPCELAFDVTAKGRNGHDYSRPPEHVP